VPEQRELAPWSSGLSARSARWAGLLSTRSPKPLLRIAVSKLADHGASYTMCPHSAASGLIRHAPSDQCLQHGPVARISLLDFESDALHCGITGRPCAPSANHAMNTTTTTCFAGITYLSADSRFVDPVISGIRALSISRACLYASIPKIGVALNGGRIRFAPVQHSLRAAE
jgi:hypothetical protein